MNDIGFFNYSPEPIPQLDEQALGIRAAATGQIIALLNTVQALRDHSTQLELEKAALATENARYKRALTDIANFNDEHWGEHVTAEMMFNLSAKAQSALDNLPF